MRMHLGYTDSTPGSVLIEMGRTRVLCTASVEDEVPRWLRNTGKGWVTAEYGMLPGSSPERIRRDSYTKGRQLEISRLIGRSLRSVVDLGAMGERMITVDCDVIQADGGTRTAAITGAYVALADAMNGLVARGLLAASPLKESVSAVSVGIVGGIPCLDLCYIEDSKAEVDMNFVITSSGRFVEVQGTAEAEPFTSEQRDDLRDLALSGCRELALLQERALKG